MNPFLEKNSLKCVINFLQFTLRLRNSYVGNGMKLRSAEDGELTNTVKSSAGIHSPITKSTTIYCSKENRDILLNLSRNAYRVIFYILYKLPKGSDLVDLSYPKVNAELDLSYTTYYRVLDELKSTKIIEKKKGDKRHYINPHILFSGNVIEDMMAKYSEDVVDVVAKN